MTSRRTLTLALASALAVGIFFLRAALDNPNEGVTLLFVLPIAIVAIEFGEWAGLAAAALSVALYAVWQTSSPDIEVGPVGYLVRALAFGLLGGLLGRFATDRRKLIEQLRHLSERDALTGLLNRHGLQNQLERELARLRRDGGHCALLMFDVDGLKRINDQFGHAAGDEALVTVARVLDRQLRPTDFAARLGGDEFVALLAGVHQPGVEVAGRRLLDSLRAESATPSGTRVPLSASVGAIVFDGATPLDGEDLLGAADHAMYSIKREGGAGIAIRRASPGHAASPGAAVADGA